MAKMPLELNYGPIILEKLDILNDKFDKLNEILKRLLEEIRK